MKIQTEKKAGSPTPTQEPPPSNASTQEAVPSSLSINPPFRGKTFASNKKLEQDALDMLEKTIGQDEQLLFLIAGDLNIHSKYAHSFLAVTDKLLYAFDNALEGGVRTHRYDQVKRA